MSILEHDLPVDLEPVLAVLLLLLSFPAGLALGYLLAALAIA